MPSVYRIISKPFIEHFDNLDNISKRKFNFFVHKVFDNYDIDNSELHEVVFQVVL